MSMQQNLAPMTSHSPELMFFSSPPSDGQSSPADEVPLLVAKAQHITKLSPGITGFLMNPDHKKAFLGVFSRQLQLLKSRSQAFEDCHVTVYDKALLMLTRNGNDLENPAAIEFYCEEYLGTDNLGNPEVADKILKDNVGLRGALRQARRKELTVATKSPMVEPSIETSYPTASPDMEPKLNNLWNVYKDAKADYLAVAQRKDSTATKAVRFLRDTAENILSYLKNKVTDPIMMAELEGTLIFAKHEAISLSAGRKRPFDVSEMEYVRGTPRGPSNLPSRTSNLPSRPNNPNNFPIGPRFGMHPGYGSRGRSVSPGRGERMAGFGGNRRDYSGPVRVSPFKYNRPVDSYQPRRPY